MSDATVSQRVEFSHDQMQSNAKLYSQCRSLVDAQMKAGDNRQDYLSHIVTIVDSLRELANTKSQFADIKRLLNALLKSGWEGSTSLDIETSDECIERLEEQYTDGKGLFVGNVFGAISAAGVAAIILAKVESDAKVRDKFARMGE